MSEVRTRGLRRFAAVVSTAALALTACSSSTSGSKGSTGSLKIGMSLPMTGPVADVSKSGLEGYQLWAADVNAKGGLLGRQVKLDVLDNGFEPNQAGGIGIDQVAFRQRDDAALDPEQAANIKMLARLRLDGLVGGDDQQH